MPMPTEARRAFEAQNASQSKHLARLHEYSTVRPDPRRGSRAVVLRGRRCEQGGVRWGRSPTSVRIDRSARLVRSAFAPRLSFGPALLASPYFNLAQRGAS